MFARYDMYSRLEAVCKNNLHKDLKKDTKRMLPSLGVQNLTEVICSEPVRNKDDSELIGSLRHLIQLADLQCDIRTAVLQPCPLSFCWRQTSFFLGAVQELWSSGISVKCLKGSTFVQGLGCRMSFPL